MKLNKIKTIIPAVALTLTAGLSSCMDDLDKGNIDPNADSEVNITGLYSKCYASLIMEGNDGNADFNIQDNGKSTLIRNVYNFNELPTDEAICWWSDSGIKELDYNQFLPGMETLQFLYYRLMSNITYYDHYIHLDEAQADKTKLAEVRFLRAYNYFLMLDFFGDPPFVDAIKSETPKQAHAYHANFDASKSYTRAELLQMGREFLFGWVKDELLAAEADMLEPSAKTDSDPNYGRADKAAAWMLLSRLYLNAGTYLNNDGQNNPYWQEALTYAEKAINESGYSLFTEDKMSAEAKAAGYKPYDLLFMGDNGSNGASCEAVLPLLQDGKTTKGWGGSLFFIAAHTDGITQTAQGTSFGTTATNWTGMRVRPEFVKYFTSTPESFVDKTSVEIRAITRDDRCLLWGKGKWDEETQKFTEARTLDLGDNSSFYQGLSITKWQNNHSTGASPHDTYDVDTDFFLLRLAEAYLNAAEAEMHLNGCTSKAKGYIDALRNRAGAATQQTYTLDYLLAERSRELYCEGQRRTDLIRFNQFGGMQATYQWSYKGGSVNGANFEKYLNVYPIPTSEILANSNLIQIDGYNEIAE